MPTFEIDGRTLTVPDGTTIMQAAHAHDIPIPHYCYHPGLSIAGNCRICLVEVEKAPKPAIACNTFVTDGMVVRTQVTSEKAEESQKAMMEFLLINHPLDCPVCDQAGECKLQDYSFKLGAGTTRFREEKEHGPKRRELGPHVVFDWERCIKCTRCIRFCDEVSGTGELDMFLRGVHEEIGVFPGKPLDNPYSGNVVDICPVGALTLRETRFAPRVYFLSDVPSTCVGCARGCSVNLGTFRNEVVRITPRENQDVNRWWICDTGRLSAERARRNEEQRLAGCRGESAGPSEGDAWITTVALAAAKLREAMPRKKLRVLASPRAGVEQNFLLARIAELLGAPVHLGAHEHGKDDELLIRRDRSPNQLGAQLVFEAVNGGVHSIGELDQALASGDVDVLLALGSGLNGPVHHEPPVIDAEGLARLKELIVFDAFRSPLSESATLLAAVTAFPEEEGSVVNFAGRLQHVARALTPRVACRPLAMLLGDLLAQLTNDSSARLSDVRRMLSEQVPAFAEIDWEALPASTGQDLAGYDAAKHACRPTGSVVQMLDSGWESVPPSPRGKPPWVW